MAGDEITHAQRQSSLHSFELPLTTNKMHRAQSDDAHLDLLSHETYTKHSIGARAF